LKNATMIALAATLLVPGLAAAADAPAKAAVCAGCHGPQGVSMNGLWPNLAGQHAEYLAKQIKAFRDGQRSDPLMTPMAAGLTDAEIEQLAAYYSSLP